MQIEGTMMRPTEYLQIISGAKEGKTLMPRAKSTTTTQWKHVPRVASFTKKQSKGEVIFTPVNKRAHKLARKCGKRTRITVEDLKQFKNYYKLREYTRTGSLKEIRL